jgi:hypothetical protein
MNSPHRFVVVGLVVGLLVASTDLHAQSRSVTRAAPDTVSRPSPIRAGALVRPETVSVGDPFVFVASVEVPVEATVQWPSIGDTASAVAMRAPARVTSVMTGTTRRETAEYLLSAWDVGVLPLGVPNATVRTTAGVLSVPLNGVRVSVRTVLPGDTSLHVPKPPRDLFPRVVPWWERWWPAAAVVAALLALWWMRRKWRTRVVKKVVPPLDVFARALHDFERLERLALANVGERGRAVALAVEVLRTYLAVRAPTAALSTTSGELLDALQQDDRVPLERLAGLLTETDGIKFARRDVSPDRAQALTHEARAIVEHVEIGERARRKADDEARRANEHIERERKAAHEDDARRASRRKSAGVS